MRRRKAALAALTAVCLLAAACGDDGGTKAQAGATTTTGTPKSGGVLTFGVFGENLGFDPVVSNGVGTNGGHEMNALYDTLVRWDPQAKTYEPRIAESLTANADSTVWTMKLRPGVMFTDGTPLNADAVIYNLQRHVKYNARYAGLVRRIADMKATDAQTVTFTLASSWPGFPFTLTVGPGMIGSPTALQACGVTVPRDCSFNTSPVGAGPFSMESFKPKESTQLKRNPTYYGGPAYLDAVRFVYIPGADATYNALKSNTIQAGFLREAVTIKKAKDEGTGGTEVLNWLGEIMLVNNGVQVKCTGGKPDPICAGKADGTLIATTPITADKRIRQAVAAAIDPKVVNERANEGAATAGNAIFLSSSQWNSGIAGPKVDAARAKQLVEEVKKEGKWNGTIRLNCDNTPNRTNTALAVKTMLEAAGFTVQLKNDYDLLALIQDVLVRKDFDLACWGFSVYEDQPLVNLESNLSSKSTGNWIGYASPAMDSAIDKTLGAKTTAEKKAALDEISRLWTEDVPSVGLSASGEFIAWRADVHGIRLSSTSSALFDKAWIG
jgi:peptide/nickel transport system substrate-binding protein